MKKRLFAGLLLLVVAMSIVSGGLPRVKAKAAIAFLFDKKTPNVILTTKKAKYIFVGGRKLDIDYNIGGKKQGIKGRWISSNPSVAKVSQSGKVKAVGNGSATIRFAYKLGNKSYEIKCKVVAKTRATDIKLLSPESFDGSMDFENAFLFKTVLSTNPKALKINPNITHNYKVFYELYMDENHLNPAPSSLATISDTGMFKTYRESGIVYLRAVGKLSKNSKSGVIYSNPVTIRIQSKISLKDALIKQTGLNKFDVTYEEVSKINKVELRDLKTNMEIGSMISPTLDNKTISVTASRNLTESMKVILISGDKRDERIVAFSEQKVAEIEILGAEASLVSFANGKGVAEISYRLLDQFGVDVTNDFRFKDKSYAVWDNVTKADIMGNKVSFALNPNQLISGYVGKFEFTYGGQNPAITKTINLRIGGPSVIKEVQIQGVYKKDLNGYAKVMDAGLNLPANTIIPYFGGSSLYNLVPDSYYLLVRVKDNNGKDIADVGAGQGKYTVLVNSATGFELDKADNKNEITSIAPVIVDGVTYLTYPVKAGILKAGTINVKIMVTGTNIISSMDMKVSDTVAIPADFTISGEGKVGGENLISYTLRTSDNRLLTKFEEVMSALGMNVYSAAIVPVDAKLIFSANSSYFIFKKNPTTGMADLYYTPNMLSLPNGTSQNIEEILLMKGTNAEKKVFLTVKAK